MLRFTLLRFRRKEPDFLFFKFSFSPFPYSADSWQDHESVPEQNKHLHTALRYSYPYLLYENRPVSFLISLKKILFTTNLKLHGLPPPRNQHHCKRRSQQIRNRLRRQHTVISGNPKRHVQHNSKDHALSTDGQKKRSHCLSC